MLAQLIQCHPLSSYSVAVNTEAENARHHQFSGVLENLENLSVELVIDCVSISQARRAKTMQVSQISFLLGARQIAVG